MPEEADNDKGKFSTDSSESMVQTTQRSCRYTISEGVFKARLDGILGSLIWYPFSSCNPAHSRGLKPDEPEIFSVLSHSTIPLYNHRHLWVPSSSGYSMILSVKLEV